MTRVPVRLRSGFSSRLAGGGFLSLGGGEGERDRETLFWCLVRKALIPPGGVPAMTVSEPKYLSEEGPNCECYRSGVRVPTHEFGDRDTDTQSTADSRRATDTHIAPPVRLLLSVSTRLGVQSQQPHSSLPHCPACPWPNPALHPYQSSLQCLQKTCSHVGLPHIRSTPAPPVHSLFHL